MRVDTVDRFVLREQVLLESVADDVDLLEEGTTRVLSAELRCAYEALQSDSTKHVA